MCLSNSREGGYDAVLGVDRATPPIPGRKFISRKRAKTAGPCDLHASSAWACQEGVQLRYAAHKRPPLRVLYLAHNSLAPCGAVASTGENRLSQISSEANSSPFTGLRRCRSRLTPWTIACSRATGSVQASTSWKHREGAASDAVFA